MTGICLDYNASTPIDPEVAEAMRPPLVESFGNPSSNHWASRNAKDKLETARTAVAALLGCEADEIVFTSGGSEANNLALTGLFYARGDRSAHIVTPQIEHPSVLEPCRFLERLGARVTYLPVDSHGLVDLDDVRKAIGRDTFLISIKLANNEVGAIQPIAEVAKIACEHGVKLHTDAAQAVGKMETLVDDLGLDLLSIAGHKFYAPKGVGALYVRRATSIEPLVHGAGHEGGRRAGTESVLLAAALGKASEMAIASVDLPVTASLCALLWDKLRGVLGNRVAFNGHPTRRLPNTLNVSFIDEIGADLLARIPSVAASTGSACHTGDLKLSPVLEAMGVAREAGRGAIRFSLGRWTTLAEIDETVALLRRAIS